MKLAVFSSKSYDKTFLSAEHTANHSSHELVYHSFPLSLQTASVAKGSDAICVFVNDTLDADVLRALHEHGVRAILLRCAGYNNVHLSTAEELGFFVANVPAYSPEAVAEFACALIQTVNRKTHRSYNRVREGNFNLEGLMGFVLHGKTVGVIGTGKIGLCLARIMRGFGCRVIAYDKYENDAFREIGEYVELDELLSQSDIVSLHCPLLESTKYIINEESLGKMKKGALLVNTSRGGLVNTKAVIAALKSQQLGGLALDVYEAEGTLFYVDHSAEIIDDDDFTRLMTFHNVIVCGHQAFLTEEALNEISDVTWRNLDDFASGRACKNALVHDGKALVGHDRNPVRI